MRVAAAIAIVLEVSDLTSDSNFPNKCIICYYKVPKSDQ